MLIQAHLGYNITSNKIRPKVKTIRSKWCKIDKALERRNDPGVKQEAVCPPANFWKY
jgi:hypothetical protein